MLSNEFLITNQLGTYVSSSFHCGNIRKYHGFLVVALDEFERRVILNRIETKVRINEKEELLSTNIYAPNVAYPKGSKLLDNGFRTKDSSIIRNYTLESGIKITQQIELAENQNACRIKYTIQSEENGEIEFIPLVTNRLTHELRKYEKITDAITSTEFKDNSVIINFHDKSSLIIKVTTSQIEVVDDIYKNFKYPIEEDRGYESIEDLLAPVKFAYHFEKGTNEIDVEYFYVKSENNTSLDFGQRTKNIRTLDLINKFPKSHNGYINELSEFLIDRSDDFVVQTANRKSIIAGYHWFDDWGRDTFISFSGILLSTKRYQEAKDILFDWSKNIKDGLLPNRPSLNEYNTLDAPLWYGVSVYNYYKHTNDESSTRDLTEILGQIIFGLITNTDYGIAMDEQTGFLNSTDNKYALTWMDAITNQKPVTPRNGSAVEIQMLWFNLIQVYLELSNKFYPDRKNEYLKYLATKIQFNFNSYFWNNSINYLNDYIDGEIINSQIRPNAIIGLALPFRLIEQSQAETILKTAAKLLLTPIGLKTLAASDPDYIAEYEGDQTKRDLAYHNGTIWPWLLGIFLIAINNNYKDKNAAHTITENTLVSFWNYLKMHNYNYIAEVFSANSQNPNGCISQAWNYATLLEVLFKINNSDQK